ncbi:MAG: hypothetical protein ACHQX4_07435 [Gemmatimonadales bacterium]
MLAAALVVGGTIAAVMPGALVGVFYDDGIYLALARSLAEGHGYHLLYLPGAPGGVHYPFGYPAFLAALWKLWPHFPANVALFRAANALLMAVFAALTVGHLADRVLGRRWAAALVVALAATALPLVTVATILFAEPLFLALAAAACWVAEAASRAAGRRGALIAALAGALAGSAALTRSIGIALVLGIVVTLFLARRPRAALIAGAVAAAILAPWSLWVAAHHAELDGAIASGYGTYGDLLRQSGWSWLSLRSFADVGGPLGTIALPPVPGLRALLAIPACALLLFGLAQLVRRIPTLGWTLAFYLGIVLVWPYGPDRFLWAALPWLAVAFVLGVESAWRRSAEASVAAGQVIRVAAAAGALGVIVGFGTFQVRGYVNGWATSTQRGISETMNTILPWIRGKTEPGAVIAGEDEALIWLYTGRHAVPNYLWRVRGRSAEGLGADSLHAWLDRARADYLVLTGPRSDPAAAVDALMGSRPGYLQMIQVWPGPMFAFRVHRAT